MTTPCLTRQNAFLLEDNERLSPLDLFCGICFESTTDQVLVKPCTCIVRNKSYLAHERCFLHWLEKNGHPLYCTRCKSKYRLSIESSLLRARLYFLFGLMTFVSMTYFLIHIYNCSKIESFKKCEIQSQFGDDTFVRVPEQLILPTISLTCLKSSFQSIPSFFISYLCFTLVLFISFIVTHYFF
ncbi:hypothetical protein BD770DRAFT_395303 [Pilaira anomala]|nr:hypothetical protein BD770DRAFT_395303 [Pilaira anomala]